MQCVIVKSCVGGIIVVDFIIRWQVVLKVVGFFLQSVNVESEYCCGFWLVYCSVSVFVQYRSVFFLIIESLRCDVVVGVMIVVVIKDVVFVGVNSVFQFFMIRLRVDVLVFMVYFISYCIILCFFQLWVLSVMCKIFSFNFIVNLSMLMLCVFDVLLLDSLNVFCVSWKS